MSVFKRRKPEETEAQAGEPGGFEERTPPSFGTSGGMESSDELGVPPFRPAPPPAAAAIMPPLKETHAMGRSPFAPSQPATGSGTAATPGMAAVSRTIASGPVGGAGPVGGTGPVGPNAGAAPHMGQPASMAGPRAGMREPSDRRTLVVGRGISVQGVVQDAERLVVEGTVEASMIHATELSISPGGVFKGEVEVEEAEVAGTIDGTLTARASLMVRATGRVLGTARCRRLQVEDGGQITGRIEMLSDSVARPAAATQEGAEASMNREAAD